MRTVPDLLRERATANPGEVAIAVDGIGDLTFGQWDRRSNALARGLVARGCRSGDVVTLSFPDEHWIDFAVSYFGVQKAGAVPLILSSRLAAPEIDDALRQAASHIIITPGASGGGSSSIAPTTLEGARGEEPFQVPVDPSSLAEIIQTSGTTGRPKLVAATHSNVLYPFLDSPVASRPTTRYVHSLHISTSAAQGLLLLPLHPGSTVSAFVVPFFEPDRFCAALAAQRATHAVLAPSLAVAIVESGAADRHDVSGLHYLSLTGAHAPASLRSRLVEAFPSAAIVVVYGCAEAGPAAVLMVHDPGRPTAVGRPVNRARVRIAGPSGRVLRRGEVGEVWLRIPGAGTRSYFRDHVAAAEVFPGGWTRTGDLGHLDAAGFLHIDDRQKDVISCGGLMVSSLEVESVLCGHPAVAEAAVFARPDRVLGESVAASVVLRCPVDAADLKSFTLGRLAKHKVPSAIFFADALPQNASGKVDKEELRRTMRSSRPSLRHPLVGEELLLARLWQEVLGTDEPIGADDDFFCLGGNSLSAARLASMIEHHLGIYFDVIAIYESPVLRALATRCEHFPSRLLPPPSPGRAGEI